MVLLFIIRPPRVLLNVVLTNCDPRRDYAANDDDVLYYLQIINTFKLTQNSNLCLSQILFLSSANNF